MYLEDTFDLEDYRNPNPGRYTPTEEEQYQWDIEALEEWHENESRRRAAQQGVL